MPRTALPVQLANMLLRFPFEMNLNRVLTGVVQ